MKQCMTAVLLISIAAHAYADKALVMTESSLSVTGLKDEYINSESIDFDVRVPRSNVIRARLEVLIFKDDIKGKALYQKLRDYDRYTNVGVLSYKIVLPMSERKGKLSLFLRVRGVRTGNSARSVESFEESSIWPVLYRQETTINSKAKSGTLGGQIFFSLNSARLTAQHQSQLDIWATQLQKTQQLSAVRIEGHADKIGNHNYNLELSRRRAEAVRDALIRRGIKRHLIDVVGYGFSRPSDDREVRSNTEGVAENRRAEVLWFSK